RLCNRSDHPRDDGVNAFLEICFTVCRFVQNDKCKDPLSLDGMWITYDSTFDHVVVLIDGIFHLCSPDAMSGDIDHIIDTANDPVTSCLIAFCSVTGKIISGMYREISLPASLVITIRGPDYRGPGKANTE